MTLKNLQLSLQFAALSDPAPHRAALPRHKVVRWIRHALASDAEITVRIVDADEGQALNRDYRGKDYATNVLTFDYEQEPLVLADLVLCAPVVVREAAELGKSLQDPTPTCWCTAPCTPRAGTTKPATKTPRPWKRARSRSWLAWGSRIPTDKAPQALRAAGGTRARRCRAPPGGPPPAATAPPGCAGSAALPPCCLALCRPGHRSCRCPA